MSKFNRSDARPNVTSAVKTEAVATGRTHEGAPGFARDVRSELFLLAVSNMVGEKTFYEGAGDRDSRFVQLVHQAVQFDPDWTAQMLLWLRGDGNMRSASIVGVAEYVRAFLKLGYKSESTKLRLRQLVAGVLQRADEPGELLGYWTSNYGRNIPKPIKRGVADAVQRLYTQRNLIKYDAGDSKGYRFGDVLELVHPSPAGDKPYQGDLFKHAIDRRHGRDTEIPEELTILRKREGIMKMAPTGRRAWLQHLDRGQELSEAGMTWEALSGWLGGPMDKLAWESIIPSMGIFALVRNLRNFDQAGVSDKAAQKVISQIADPEVIARSRMFPFRFLSAYRAAPSLRWSYPLEQAVNFSLGNVPALPGKTLILVDQSGSMFSRVSDKSQVEQAELAAIFGSALALRAKDATLVQYGSSAEVVKANKGDSLLTVTKRFTCQGGTETAKFLKQYYQGHDRVILVTDEQAWGYYGGTPGDQIPKTVPLYTWNLVGYRHGHESSGQKNRHAFGGLTDQAFKIIPMIEAGRNGTWPWETASQ